MDLQKVIRKLKSQRYSQNTTNTYVSCLKTFSQHFNGEIDHLENLDIEKYIYHLVEKGYSRSAQNQHINAIKFYFERILGQDRKVFHIERPQKEFRLPTVLSEHEIVAILSSISNLKHKVVISLIYSAGLRISEVVNLKIQDIDSERMLIKIRKGKGAKDRVVPLAENMLQILRKYYKQYRPKEYLFNGAKGGQYSPISIRNVLKRASRKAGIRKNVTPHILRHSYATHLLESGVDIRYIQKILGHNSLKTTEIYTHVSTKSIQGIQSPIAKMQL